MKSIALALACASCASVPATDNFGKPFPAWVPNDVRAFVADAQACTHFSGEEPYDAERRAFLDRMIQKTCSDLDVQKAELRHRYARSGDIQSLILEAWNE
jgi:hypothetical protein